MTNPCDNLLDPLGGVTIQPGFNAVSTIVDGEVVWSTNPPHPPSTDAAPLRLQLGGPLLIDEGIFLAIK